jgi:TolB protein
MDLNTGAVQSLTETDDDENTSFAPNGRLNHYATRDQGREVLMTTTLDGKFKSRLGSTHSELREPSWGPYPR